MNFLLENPFYDGTKLLSLSDLYGRRPEIYMCTTNRSAGKTTYFSRLLVNKYKKGQGKFMLVYRNSYEPDGAGDKFFKDINGLFFPSDVMTSAPKNKGIYTELFLNGESCGYAVSLNQSDNIRKISHFFSDVERMFFDEFQSETNTYVPNEITKFQSLHQSVARGKGKQSRYVPVYMCSNTVSIINPYYIAFGISSRLSKETKFLKGDGFVLEQGYNEGAAKAQSESGFNRAFAGSKYQEYAAQNVYLNDNMAFIETPEGSPRYMGTLRYNGGEYAVKSYPSEGIVYCDDRPDRTFPVKIAVTTEDHQVNYVMLKQNAGYIAALRWYFNKGCFRFKNLTCKEAVLTALSY